MPFPKSLQGSKSTIVMHPVSIESALLLFFLKKNFLASVTQTSIKKQGSNYKIHVINDYYIFFHSLT